MTMIWRLEDVVIVPPLNTVSPAQGAVMPTPQPPTPTSPSIPSTPSTPSVPTTPSIPSTPSPR